MSHFRQERDNPAVAKAIWIGVLSALVFAVSIVAAIKLLHEEQASLMAAGVPPAPTQLGKPEVGIVIQRMFEVYDRTEKRMSAQHKYLDSYGWVDRAQGTIHIPIEQAMELVVKESTAP